MLHWSSHLGQEQTQGPSFAPFSQVYYPPPPASKSHCRTPRVAHTRAARQASLASPRPPPGPAPAPISPPLRPAPAPRTLLFTSMVPRQPLPAPCRWLRFMLRPGPAAASSGRAAPRERKERVRGRRAGEAAAARAPPHRHLQRGGRGSGLRVELRSASSSRGGTEGRTGGAAGGDTTPSLRASAAAAKAEEEEEGAEQRRQAPQSRSRPPPPQARARAPEPGGSRGACTRSPAAFAEGSAARAPPTPNRKRAPAPASPTNRYAPREARGRTAFSRIPPTAVRLAPRGEGGAGSPEAFGPLPGCSRRAGKRMRRLWCFRLGKAGRKRERTWRGAGAGAFCASAGTRLTTRSWRERAWLGLRCAAPLVAEARWFCSVPGAADPTSTLGCCSVQQRPSTTQLSRLGVQLQLWLQNKSFSAPATVTRGEHKAPQDWFVHRDFSAILQVPGGREGAASGEGK